MKAFASVSMSCIAAAILFVPYVAAQTTGVPAPLPPIRKEAVRSPESILPPPLARPSTAQAGPLHAGWKPLKEMPALQLTGVDGKSAALSPAGQPRHWLLIYRAADCIPCDRLMLALAASTSPELKKGKPYTVLVDSPKPDALEIVRASFTGLSDANWVADRNKQAFAALKPRGSPVVYAMEGNRIAWSLAGGLDSTATVTHIADSWIAANAETSDKSQTVETSSASGLTPATVTTPNMYKRKP